MVNQNLVSHRWDDRNKSRHLSMSRRKLYGWKAAVSLLFLQALHPKACDPNVLAEDSVRSSSNGVRTVLEQRVSPHLNTKLVLESILI
jgi:hypothetical protein